jgi:hypothetical protein
VRAFVFVTYQSTQGVEAERDLRNVATLVQIRRLENFLLGNAVLFQRRLKPAQQTRTHETKYYYYYNERICYRNSARRKRDSTPA